MALYRFTVRRYVEESADIEVEASDPALATVEAWRRAFRPSADELDPAWSAGEDSIRETVEMHEQEDAL